jgi:hypothetical protein
MPYLFANVTHWRFLPHDSHIWAGGRFRFKCEVLALHRGWRARRSSTICGWKHSPAHRSVLLSGRYRAVGAAPVRGVVSAVGGRPSGWPRSRASP